MILCALMGDVTVQQFANSIIQFGGRGAVFEFGIAVACPSAPVRPSLFESRFRLHEVAIRFCFSRGLP
jgi:hypothetical protein